MQPCTCMLFKRHVICVLVQAGAAMPGHCQHRVSDDTMHHTDSGCRYYADSRGSKVRAGQRPGSGCQLIREDLVDVACTGLLQRALLAAGMLSPCGCTHCMRSVGAAVCSMHSSHAGWLGRLAIRPGGVLSSYCFLHVLECCVWCACFPEGWPGPPCCVAPHTGIWVARSSCCCAFRVRSDLARSTIHACFVSSAGNA